MSALRCWRRSVMLGLLFVFATVRPGRAADISEEAVLLAISRAKDFLVKRQESGGYWIEPRRDHYRVGVTSLALLALLNAGMTTDDESVARALKYLRAVKEPKPATTYEISLMIMALAAAKDGQRDKSRLISLAHRLEESQIKIGNQPGSWGYGRGKFGPDRSNGQFAILGLRDASEAGVPVSRRTWELASQH